MKEKNKLIVKILSCAAKLSTATIPSAHLQTLSGEGIDALAEFIQDVPEEMPTPRSTLLNYDDVIINAVEDLINASNIVINENNIFATSPEQLAKMIMNGNNALRDHEERNESAAKNALLQYLQQLKLWSISQPTLLIRGFESYGNSIRELYGLLKANEKHDESVSPSKMFPDIWEYDAYFRENDSPNHFYRYFKADPTISVDQFFWCTNYKLRKLDSDIDNLQDAMNTAGANLDLTRIMAIVHSSPLVFITGLYGTGKTALLKRIHFELRKEDEVTVVYLHAKDLLQIMDTVGFTTSNRQELVLNKKEMDEVFTQIKKGSQSVFILIDELDELNRINGKKTYLEIFSKWMSEFLDKKHDYRFVLSARKFAQIDMNTELCIADLLYYEYGIEHEDVLNVICADRFCPETRDAWIEMYARKNDKYASYSNIKDDYGKIASALGTPIFLYAFMQKYVSGKCDPNITGYYYYYSQFIEKTIGGKYGQKHAAVNTIGLSAEQYHAMLQKLAYRILHNNHNYLSTKIQGNSFPEEQLLLGDELEKKKFEIALGQLNDPDIPIDERKYETASSINCFFLSSDRHRVYFTDTNILFSLASEYVFKSIERIVRDGNTDFHLEHLEEMQAFHLYPHLMDYIIYLAKNSRYADEIRGYLHSFIINPKIKSHLIDLSKDFILEKILLLYILFLKLNRQPYNTPDNQHIIKEIIFYVNAYKTDYFAKRSQTPFTIERYFMKLRLHHLDLRRINLKNYNFQESIITDSSIFYQCKFNKTTMTDVIMDDCHFSLCQFKRIDKMTLSRKSGNPSDYQATFDTCDISETSMTAHAVLFRNCKIDNLILTMQGAQRVEFINCYIKKMRVMPLHTTNSRIPKFSHCILEDKPSIDKYDRLQVDSMLKEGKNIILK